MWKSVVLAIVVGIFVTAVAAIATDYSLGKTLMWGFYSALAAAILYGILPTLGELGSGAADTLGKGAEALVTGVSEGAGGLWAWMCKYALPLIGLLSIGIGSFLSWYYIVPEGEGKTP